MQRLARTDNESHYHSDLTAAITGFSAVYIDRYIYTEPLVRHAADGKLLYYSAAGTPSLMPDGEVHACPEETMTFTRQTQSWLWWMIQFEGVFDSTVEHTYLPTDSEGRTMMKERRGM